MEEALTCDIHLYPLVLLVCPQDGLNHRPGIAMREDLENSALLRPLTTLLTVQSSTRKSTASAAIFSLH